MKTHTTTLNTFAIMAVNNRLRPCLAGFRIDKVKLIGGPTRRQTQMTLRIRH